MTKKLAVVKVPSRMSKTEFKTLKKSVRKQLKGTDHVAIFVDSDVDVQVSAAE